MANKVLSIEIGQQTTKICEVDYQKKNPCVYSCMTFDMPNGVVDDGYIRDKVAFATVLKENLTKANIKNDKVIFTISSTKIANREVMIPLVKDNRIQDIVSANASEYFPVNIEEYNITYSILERINNKEEKQIRLIVLAAPSNLIQTYYELADILKFNIVAIDYVGNSSFQLLRNQLNNGINMVVQINENNTLINILENDSLLLQRILPYGVSTVVDEVLGNTVLGASNKADALKLLCSERLINTQFDMGEEDFASFTLASDEYNTKIMKENAKEELTNSFKHLVNNVNRVLDYFATKNQNKKITVIHLTGEGSLIQGVDLLFRNEIGLEVQVFSKLHNVTFSRFVAKVGESESNFISCIGATIAPIDFVPKENIAKKKSSGDMTFMFVLLGIVIAASLTIFLTSFFFYKDSLNKRDVLYKNIKSIESIVEVKKEYTESIQKHDALAIFDSYTSNRNNHFVEFLTELQGKFPSKSLIQSMEVTPEEVTINIAADKMESVAKFVLELRSFESIYSVSITSVTADDTSEETVPKIKCAVYCTYKR